MSFHRYASLVLVFAVSACASSSSTPFGEEAATTTAARAARGNSTLIVRAELAQLFGDSVQHPDGCQRFPTYLWLEPDGGKDSA